MAKTNFQYEKRQRELEKKRKAEEKARRKQDAKLHKGQDEPDGPEAQGEGQSVEHESDPA
ncbi:hypothetical protein [Massilia sp. 9096]|uniref:hypothetical protein n=1 Tax=Massilia sp. 9096 TaxID=1500894 RepID=UPI0005627023|nr:hypothetical protein [Massilia sp. 9096]